jgi:hypothetical protein
VKAVAVTIEIKDMKKLQRQLKKLEKAPQKVINSTIGEMKTRVPSWIATEVSKVYGIDKKEITDQKAGTVKVQGSRMDNIVIDYQGRMLTHAHFGMSPKAPKEDRGGYTIKASVIRGQKKVIGRVKKLTKKQKKNIGRNFTHQGTQNSPTSPNMLLTTKAKRADAVQFIPFQRTAQVTRGRKGVWEKFTAISLPQMVSSERTAPNIQKAIDENLEKRLDHYMNRYMGS